MGLGLAGGLGEPLSPGSAAVAAPEPLTVPSQTRPGSSDAAALGLLLALALGRRKKSGILLWCLGDEWSRWKVAGDGGACPSLLLLAWVMVGLVGLAWPGQPRLQPLPRCLPAPCCSCGALPGFACGGDIVGHCLAWRHDGHLQPGENLMLSQEGAGPHKVPCRPSGRGVCTHLEF